MSPAESLTLDLDELERTLTELSEDAHWKHDRDGHVGPDHAYECSSGVDRCLTRRVSAALDPSTVSELIRLARIALEARDE